MTLTYKNYSRKPFTVLAIQITNENIEELSEKIGELRFKKDGGPYIQVDRRLVPNMFRVYPGFWMTVLGDGVRCYTNRVFHDQYELSAEQTLF